MEKVSAGDGEVAIPKALGDYRGEPEPPIMVVDQPLPASIAGLSGPGGFSKTSTAMALTMNLVTGRDIAGHRVLRSGPVLFVTKEDNVNIFRWRFAQMLRRGDWSADERKMILRGIRIYEPQVKACRIMKAGS